MLYLVGTPIGNLDDMSPRAKEVLAGADLIACEDTRRTGLLLQSFGIKNKMTSYHEHNKASKGPGLVEDMKNGMNVALVSDAGMPCINDPGEDLVKLCIEAGVEVSAVPGPVAAITALCVSGISSATFHYEGFLPSENGPRKKRIEELKKINETIILYEAPHRLLKLISELDRAGFGGCDAAFCRELTKKFEQVIRLPVSGAAEYFDKTPPKGEFVVVLSPLKQDEQEEKMTDMQIDEEIRRLHEEGLPTKKIAAAVAEMSGKGKKEMYDYVLSVLK